VRIRNFIHKGLKGLYLKNSSKGVPPDTVDKLRAMLTFLQDMQRVEVAPVNRTACGSLEPFNKCTD